MFLQIIQKHTMFKNSLNCFETIPRRFLFAKPPLLLNLGMFLVSECLDPYPTKFILEGFVAF